MKEERLGFMAICLRYRTFVCSNCKSAHQSFSHRCKDAAQSAWQMAEVRELDEQKGGGNRAALGRWLANVPDGERPTEGSPLEAYKRFVDQAYIQGRWADEQKDAAVPDGAEAAIPPASPDPPEEVEVSAQRRRHRRRHKDSGAEAGDGEHHRRHHSRRHERRGEPAASEGWLAGDTPAWPEEAAAVGSGGFPGWQDGPAGPTFQMGPALETAPSYCNDDTPTWNHREPSIYPNLGQAVAWVAVTPAYGSSPTDHAGSDVFGWQTPSNSTDGSVYPSPTGSLSFGALLSESQPPNSLAPGRGWNASRRGPDGLAVAARARGSCHSGLANPWAEATDLPCSNAGGSGDPSPASAPAARRPRVGRGAADAAGAPVRPPRRLRPPRIDPANPWAPVVGATNPWAEDVLRPKAAANSAALPVGKRPVVSC
eukprot:CAMPEP_0175556290 /NCGR_PEP_ID=MMETSP0096-20121207/34792_1 /TAXON_ID=311494 /ORGANISM="Alexandrium monilatum, Strain CCMP3105" /LENGTH=425 /DNA_ID=CAMNT_0016859421 /DNA_START=50 /DNA_END=1327 /DNA_ORIENTATION=-